MSSSEREVLEKFHQLDHAAQQRMRDVITQEATDTASFDFAAWSHEVEAIRREIRADHGGQLPAINVVDLLRGIRDGEDE